MIESAIDSPGFWCSDPGTMFNTLSRILLYRQNRGDGDEDEEVLAHSGATEGSVSEGQ